MNKADRKLPLQLVFPILLVYCVVSALGIHYHELFLDEAHHFLVPRDSATLAEFYDNLRYDGHPRLWGGLLFFITHYITANPVAMRIFHLLITASAVFVFLRYAPFSLPMKILILSGYYFLFEYNWLSRNYAPGILLLFICCHLLRDAEKNLLRIGCLILLLCSTHVFFTFASMGIFGYLFIDYARQKKLLTRRFLLFTGLFLVGFASALIQARTPTVDNVNMSPVHPDEWLSVKNFSFAAFALIKGWLPIPQVHGGHFWNSYWLNKNNIPGVIEVALFLGLLIFPALLLRKKIGPFIFYYTCVGMLLAFFVVTQMVGSRYFGMVYIFFLAAAWMTADETGEVFSMASIPGGRGVKLFFLTGLFVILVIQTGVGVFALEEDIKLPFSESKHTADYLKGLQPAGRPIVVDGYNAGPQLCAYLEGKVFYLATGAEGSFCVWKKSYFPRPRPPIGEEIARNPALRRMGEFILVSNRALPTDSIRSAAGNYRLQALRSFDNSIIGENYWVYQVDPF